MPLEQALEVQRGGEVEVWQRLPVYLGDHILEREYGSERVSEYEERWVLVAIFPTRDEAIRFWNASFLACKERAPMTAGVGDGKSLREPWISALRVRSAESAWEDVITKEGYHNA